MDEDWIIWVVCIGGVGGFGLAIVAFGWNLKMSIQNKVRESKTKQRRKKWEDLQSRSQSQ